MDDDWLIIEPFVPTNPRIDITPEELLRRYTAGERDFERVHIQIGDFDTHPLVNANLSGINLRFAKFSDPYMMGCNLSRADLTGAKLSACLEGANLSYANLTGADLYRTGLHDADLSYANLTGAEMYNDLRKTNLTGAILRNTNLEEVVLHHTNLTGADLTGAIFGSGTLLHTNLTNAILEGVDWSSIRFDNTIMPDGSIRIQ